MNRLQPEYDHLQKGFQCTSLAFPETPQTRVRCPRRGAVVAIVEKVTVANCGLSVIVATKSTHGGMFVLGARKGVFIVLNCKYNN